METWKSSHFSAAPSANENSLMWCQANHTQKKFQTQISPEGTPVAKVYSPCFILFTPIMSHCNSLFVVHLLILLLCIKTAKGISLPPSYSKYNGEETYLCTRKNRKQQLSECSGQLNSLVCLTVHTRYLAGQNSCSTNIEVSADL